MSATTGDALYAPRRARKGQIALLFALLILGILPFASRAGAVSGSLSGRGHPEGSQVFGTGGNSGFTGTQIVNVYAEPGETVDLFLARTNKNDGTLFPSGTKPLSATLTSPSGVTTNCTVPAGTASCEMIEPVAAAGVWVATFDGGPGTGGELAQWELGARTGGTFTPGRVFADSYRSFTDAIDASGFDPTFYAVADGRIYDIEFESYGGYYSAVAASTKGIHQDCVPYRKSVLWPFPAGIDDSPCADSQYRLFIEPPAADLPDSIVGVAAPLSITNVGWTPAATTTTGTLTFNLSSSLAQEVKITGQTADGTTIYDQPYDASPGANSTMLDVPVATGPITWTVSADKQGEMHVVLADVESIGSFSIKDHATGSAVPVYYDDRDMRVDRLCPDWSNPSNRGDALSANGVLQDPIPARSWEYVPPVAGCGVEGGPFWEPGNDLMPYGDTAIIDTWTYQPSDASGSVTVDPSADLAVTKTYTGESPVQPGGPLEWEIEVTNNGPDTAENTVLTDTGGNGTQTTGATADKAGADCTTAGINFTCALGDMAIGDTVTITVAGTALEALDGIPGIWNYAAVGSDTNDPNLTDNQDAAGRDPNNPAAPADPNCAPGCYPGEAVVGVASADVIVTKTAVTSRVQAGGPIEWNINVENAGPDEARNVVLSDTSGTGTNTVDTVDTVAPGVGTCTITGITFTCDLGTIAPGRAINITVQATADMNLGELTGIWNYAAARSTTPDPIPSNNDDSAGRNPNNPAAPSDPAAVADPDGFYSGDTMIQVAEADVQVVKTVDASTPVQPGGTINWTVVVTNAGPDEAQNVTLADLGGNGMDAQSATSTGAVCTSAGLNITCDIGTLAPGETVTINVISAASAALTPGQAIWNLAEAMSTTRDPIPANNAADSRRDPNNPAAPSDPNCGDSCYPGEAVILAASADVVVEKTATNDAAIQPGGNANWKVVVRNDGPDLAKDVVLTDNAGTGTDSVVSAVTDRDGVACTIDGVNFTCALGDIATGDMVTINVVSKASADVGDLVSLWNYAFAGSTTPDINMGNNDDGAGRSPDNQGSPSDPGCVSNPDGCYSGDTAAPFARADVAVTKVVSGDAQVAPGETVTFDLTIENLGPDTAINVVAADEAQEALDLTEIRVVDAGAAENVAVDGNVVTIASLPSGAKVTAEADFIAGDLEGTVRNVWFAKADTFDPDMTNNVDDGPADPSDPNDGDSDCTTGFAGCALVVVSKNQAPSTTTTTTAAPDTPPSTTAAPVTPASPTPASTTAPSPTTVPSASTPAPSTPTSSTPSSPSTLATTGASLSVLLTLGLGLLGGGAIIAGRRRED